MEDQARNKPRELLELANELRGFARYIKDSEQEVKDRTGRLNARWKDQEYDKFKASMEATYKHLEQLTAEIDRVVPLLQQDADDLQRFLSITE